MAATALTASAPPVDILGILSGLGLTRQGEMAIASSVLVSAWTSLMNGRIMPMVTPVLFKYFIAPFFNALKSIGKAIAFIGILIWLFAMMVPIILTSVGIAGASSFVGRALNSPNFAYSQYTGFATNFSDRALEYFELNNEECREMISCRAGEFVVENYPAFLSGLNRIGLLDRLDRYSKQGNDKYVGKTMQALTGGLQNGTCDETLDPCAGWANLEAFFDPSKRKNETLEFTTVSPTTSTPPPDSIVGFISRIAADAIRG